MPRKKRGRADHCLAQGFWAVKDCWDDSKRFLSHNCIMYTGFICVCLADVLLFVATVSKHWSIVILDVNLTKAGVPLEEEFKQVKQQYGLFSDCETYGLCEGDKRVLFENNEDVRAEMLLSITFCTLAVLLAVLTLIITPFAWILGTSSALCSGAAGVYAGIALAKWGYKLRKYAYDPENDTSFGDLENALGWSWAIAASGASFAVFAAFFVCSGANYMNKEYEEDIEYNLAKADKRAELIERKMKKRALKELQREQRKRKSENIEEEIV